MISYRHDTGAWLNAAGDHAIGSASEPPRLVRDDEMTPCMALEDFVDLKLGHYNKDGIEVVDVEGEIDVYTAPRLRELLIDLVNKNNYQLVVNMEKVEFLDSTGLGVLVGGQGLGRRDVEHGVARQHGGERGQQVAEGLAGRRGGGDDHVPAGLRVVRRQRLVTPRRADAAGREGLGHRRRHPRRPRHLPAGPRRDVLDVHGTAGPGVVEEDAQGAVPGPG